MAVIYRTRLTDPVAFFLFYLKRYPDGVESVIVPYPHCVLAVRRSGFQPNPIRLQQIPSGKIPPEPIAFLAIFLQRIPDDRSGWQDISASVRMLRPDFVFLITEPK